MKVRSFLPHDVENYKEWYKKRTGQDFDLGMLPDVGYAVCTDDEGKIPIFYAFLMLTNTRMCFIEGLLAHPGITPTTVEKAGMLVFPYIEEQAKSLGNKYIFGFTQIDTVEKYATNCGFTQHPLKFTGVKKEL